VILRIVHGLDEHGVDKGGVDWPQDGDAVLILVGLAGDNVVLEDVPEAEGDL
jgi:hypothetical protein